MYEVMEAKDYLSSHRIPQIFECLLSGLMYNRPKDPVKYLQECLSKIENTDLQMMRWDLFLEASRTRTPLPPIRPENGFSREATKLLSKESTIAEVSEVQKSPLPPIGSTINKPSNEQTDGPTAPFAKHEFVLLLGGPGLSKNVFGENLARGWPGFVHISMGSILRSQISKSGSMGERWQMAESLITKGELAPDALEQILCANENKKITMDLLLDHIKANTEARGFIIDGFPRTISQVEEYNEAIGTVTLALLIDAEEQTLQEMLLRRGHETGRLDDSAAAVARRLAFFKANTLPVCKFYDDQGLLRVVNGETSKEEMYQELVAAMSAQFGAPAAGAEQLRFPHPPPGPRPMSRNRSTGPVLPPEGATLDIKALAPSVPDMGRKEVLPQCPLILLMGGPGSGRSQQATAVCERYNGFKHISVQDVAKRHVIQKSDATQTWDLMANLVVTGEVGVDEVTAEMICQEMKQLDTDDLKCVILEGYPHTAKQLDDFNAHIGRADLVLLLDCDELYMTLRLLERGRDSGRVEDNLAAIARRMAFYKDETLSVVRHYDESGRLVVILGDRDTTEVFYDLCSLIDYTFFKQLPTHVRVSQKEEDAAVRIQAAYRGYSVRKEQAPVKPKPEEEEIQEEAVEETIQPVKATLLGVDEDGGKKSEADALKQCKVIFVTGGPGSGKGTQCQKILEDFDVGHVSTGDLIRAEVETGSERAKQMKEVMEKGELVSLDIVLELLREHLVKNASQHKGFLVDGFPREIDQATRFEKEVVECLCMLYMDASEEEMKSRILERAKTSGRSDDNEETIAKRIETFKSHNDAIVQHFEEKKKLVKIDCNSTDVDAIYATVREALEKQGLERKGAENANGEANNTAKEGAAAEEAKPEGDANAAETGDGAKEEAKEEEKKE